MAKALLGFVGTSADPRILAELESLRRRVQTLQSDLAAARTELAALRARDAQVASLSLPDEDLVRLADLQHATV